MTASFDVFISYNSHDRALVDELIDRLKGRFIRAWVDDGELLPGTSGFQHKIEAAILDAPAAIIAIGPAGMGPWQEFEVDLCLEQSMRRSIRVIPILLPGSALGLLPARIAARFVIVDFSEGLDNPKRLDRLELGITGHALAAIPVNLSAAPAADTMDLSDRLDTYAMAEIKARVYKAAEATASLAAALIADVDDGHGNDLTRWVSLLISLRWERGYLAAFERLFRVRRTEQSLQDYNLTLLVEDDPELDGLLGAVPDTPDTIVVTVSRRAVAKVKVSSEPDRSRVQKSLNAYGRLGRPLSGTSSLKSRLGSVPVATVEHEDGEAATFLYQNREALAVLAARFGLPGQDRLLRPINKSDESHTRLAFTRGRVEVGSGSLLTRATRSVEVDPTGIDDGFDHYVRTLESTEGAMAAIKTIFGDGPDAVRESWKFHLSMQQNKAAGGSG